MASNRPSKPAGKPKAPSKKAPLTPAGTARPLSNGRPERPIADVDRKVRGGEA